MKFVMTGHRGLIGTSLLERLKSGGHKPLALFDLAEGTDIRLMDNGVGAHADVLFHLAAYCKINGSINYPARSYNHNVAGMYAVMEYAHRNKIPKVVFTSSTRVLYPNKNPYVASKIFGEEMVKAYHECYGIDYVIIRPSTVYGLIDDKAHRLIDLWMRAVLKNEPLKIYGDINKTLDFTYIDDFIDAFILASQQTNKEFDIATGRSEKLIDVAEDLVKMADSNSPIDFELPEMAQPQEVEIDISEVVKLGYKPKVDVYEGLRRTLEFYKKLYAR